MAGRSRNARRRRAAARASVAEAQQIGVQPGAEQKRRVPRWLPALLAFPFLEVGATVLLTHWLGATAAFALYAAPAAIGLLVLWSRYPRMRAAGQKMSEMGAALRQAKSRRRVFSNPEWAQVTIEWGASG